LEENIAMTTEDAERVLRDRFLDALLSVTLDKEDRPLADLHRLLDSCVRDADGVQAEDLAVEFAEVHRQIDALVLTVREATYARAALMLSVAAGLSLAAPAAVQGGTR
jgi:hypothetical protein